MISYPFLLNKIWSLKPEPTEKRTLNLQWVKNTNMNFLIYKILQSSIAY